TESALEDLRGYSARLRGYSDSEIEDVYFNIHILRHPLRYRLLRMELERRGLQGFSRPDSDSTRDLRARLESVPFLKRNPVLCSVIAATAICVISSVAALAMVASIRVFGGRARL